jgi:bile acid:Na+ symporter, BASS family
LATERLASVLSQSEFAKRRVAIPSLALFFEGGRMTMASLVILFLKVSIILTVFGLGLRASFSDATYLFRHPGLLLKSLLSMNVIVPVFAMTLALAVNLTPPVKIAIVLLSFSPVPPFLPGKQFKLGGSNEYIFGLLVAVSLLSIVIVSLGPELLGWALGHDLNVEPMAIAKVMLTSVLLPLFAGIIVRYLATSFADRSTGMIVKIAGIMLLLSLIPILFVTGSTMISLIGNGTLIAMAAVVIIGLIAGHLLGGPSFGNRSVLALASATRHPGIALVLATALFPDQKKLIIAAILLYLLVNAIVSLPYMAWCKKHQQRATTATA